MLDNIMMYWLPAAGASSARLYWESFRQVLEPKPQIQIPVGASIFPHEIIRASKRWCEERYAKLIHYNVLDKGGHFAAFEQPATFVNELRTCFRKVR
jgi:pimeloyl-ACP methyl ester carboxylesterase